MSDQILRAALSYAERGWRVVPLLPRGKRPAIDAWQDNATTDEDTIVAWWEANPSYNVGIALGEQSGIVDIEYDTDQGRETASRLFAETYTPSFASGSRSVHRLFRWSSDLPQTAVIKDLRGLEIRIGGGGKGAQSVFPPSVHPNGPTYQWDRGMSPDDVEIATIPDSVLALIVNDPEGKSLEHIHKSKGSDWWESIINGVGDGERNQTLTSMVGAWLRALSDEAFHERNTVRMILLNATAFGRRCNPPIDQKEIERTFQSVLRLETNRRASEEAFSIVKPSVTAQAAEGATTAPPDEGWWLVIVKSDPPRYELHSPDFSLADGSKIVLSAEQMASPGAIRVEALKQARCGLPASFSKKWNKKGGLYEMLVSSAETVEAPPEEKRHAVVAEMILGEIDKAKILEEGDNPSTRGASMMPNGNVVFVFSEVMRRLCMMPEAPTRAEMSKVLKMGSCDKPKWVGRTRFICVTPTSVKSLRKLAGSNPDSESHESPL